MEWASLKGARQSVDDW